MPALTSTHLQRIQQAVYNKVDKTVTRINAKKRPLLAWLQSKIKPTDLTGGTITTECTVESSLEESLWVGDDEIEASEPSFQLPLEWGYFNFNVAIKILHDKLKRLGYTILPNGDGKLEDRAMSKNDGLKLINYLKELIFEANDAYDRRLDLLLHRTGSQNPNAQPGVLGITGQSASTGNVGGKARASYSALQHQVATGLTVTNGGTFANLIERAHRRADLYSGANGVPGEVDRVFAGESWIEGHKAYCRANGLSVNADVAGVRKADPTIPDSAVYVDGRLVVHDPTMETLDALETFSPTLTKSALHLNSSVWQFWHEHGLNKHASSPQDPPNKRLTRQDLDGTYALGCKAPASNAYTAIA